MTCQHFSNAIVCGPDIQDFLCFEHTTYLLEWHNYCGPTIRTWPEDEDFTPDEDSVLWDYINEWIKMRRLR